MARVASLPAALTQRRVVVAVGAAIALTYSLKKRGSAEGKGKDSKKNSKFELSVFRKQLSRILRIVVPGVGSNEALLLALHTAILVSRSFLSIVMIKVNGAIAKTIVDEDIMAFFREIGKLLLVAIPSSYVNSMIKFLENKLSIAFRTRLTDHSRDLYMRNLTYYRVDNLDSRLANADQCLTEDISKFCQALAAMWSQALKPTLDIILMVSQLIIHNKITERKKGSTGSTFTAISFGTAVTLATAWLLRACSPPFGKLVAEQAGLEGDLRFTHSRVITNAEEIAFYGGHKVEATALEKSYTTLVRHMNKIYKLRVFYNFLESFTLKYVWNAAGMVMIAVPSFLTTQGRGDTSEASNRAESFVTSKSFLINSADAVERLMSSYKELTELAGYTTRVSSMLDVFADINKGKFVKAVSSGNAFDTNKRGRVVEGDGLGIKFEDVPIVTPAGDVLLESLSFEVQEGMHVLIAGPNGCGKSSLFRILGGLWPVYGGTLTRPLKRDLFYIPQRPYLSTGTFRDQVIYPDTVKQMAAKGITDKDLDSFMDVVALRDVVAREGGWDARNAWLDVLSGGEKQRVAMARLFYHRPRFAVLDECTSAVSFDVEGQMYTHAKAVGITLLTVSHRSSLWQYHTHLLQFSGNGTGYVFKPFDDSEILSLSEEKAKLEATLIDVPKAEARLRELCDLLGEDSTLFSQK